MTGYSFPDFAAAIGVSAGAVAYAVRGPRSTLLAPSVTRRLIQEFVRRPPDTLRSSAPELARLTAREVEVLQMMARGRSNTEIATDLFVSETTVKTHVAHVLAKLGLRDRVQAVVFAYEAGIVLPGDSG